MNENAVGQLEAFREFELMDGLDSVAYRVVATNQEPRPDGQGALTGYKRIVPGPRLEAAGISLLSSVKNELAGVIPWFFEQMPPLYDVLTSEEEKHDQILDIVSGKVFNESSVVERNNSKRSSVTFMASKDEKSGLAKMAAAMRGRKGTFCFLISSLDQRLAIGNLDYGPYRARADWAAQEVQAKRKITEGFLAKESQDHVSQYLAEVDARFALRATPKMLAIGYTAVRYALQTDTSYVAICHAVEAKEEARVRLDIGLKGFSLTSACDAVVGICARYDVTVRRIVGNLHVTSDGQEIVVLHVIARPKIGMRLEPASPVWGRIVKALKSLSFVDHGDDFAALLQGPEPFSINEANLVRATANWSHIFLSKENPYYYTYDRVARVLVRSDQFLQRLIAFFRARFDPRFSDDRPAAAAEVMKSIESIIVETSDEIERNILRESFNFVRHVQKTNYFLVSKAALSFRIDPSVLNPNHYSETPFGIFYMIGRGMRGFQVRYRDIARGGVRVVMPRTAADFDSALAGLFDEVNGLAYAQQLKNKDIPEGGSKAVLVVEPGADKNLAVKSAISGLLDLITTDEQGHLVSGIIDYYRREEILFLGPDENMTNDLINWTVEHALHRGYRYAWSFMSSKPEFGINHKEYGVTSEGVNVYLANTLAQLGLLAGSKSFRIKMTGGPDGDVAGNLLKIIHRDYGERARIVAIADGLGAAFDPAGLDWSELLRLEREGKSIVEFDSKELSSGNSAFVIAADTRDNVKVRDNLYATVDAEIFIPAGGRPYTVKDKNWHRFIKADGVPSAQAIIEGANIFFTNLAREKLVEQGVVVIKDSSANKCGVICSSYEIIACMTLSPQEFAVIKDVYVKEVIDILKDKADLEAKLLFREKKRRGNETDLVKLSYDISAEINRVTDILREKLLELSQNPADVPKFRYVLLAHCPKVLVQKYEDRILNKIPRSHQAAIISAAIASRLVYKEGIDWLRHMDVDAVFAVATQYIDAEREIDTLTKVVQGSGLAQNDTQTLVSILKGVGAKHLASSLAQSGRVY
jgi:glutamate dehydrogenase